MMFASMCHQAHIIREANIIKKALAKGSFS